MPDPARRAGSDAAQPPGARWQAGVAQGRWQDDPAQRAALPALDRLHAAVLDGAPTGWWRRLLRREGDAGGRGLYLWGGVGRGKTFLLDLLAEGLDDGSGRVRRRHFHRFMGEVHAALRRVRQEGRRDPLAEVAAELARHCRLLCLDEFVVHDIGDAMILAGLLDGLFARGVRLATTSNTEPAQLYRDGLQRARFAPAIALLERHCQVLHLDSPVDYRLRQLQRAPVFRVPADADADAQLGERLRELAAGALRQDTVLTVEERPIPARALAEGSAWFDFAALCEGPRSVADYIEIARSFNTVLLSGVPAFGAAGRDDAAKRFIHLIDELYDRRVKLLATLAVPVPQLYPPHGRLRGQFERTESRLIEMQGVDYLAQPHRP